MIKSKIDYLDYLKADKEALGFSNQRKPRKHLDLIWQYEILLRRCEYFQNCKNDIFSKLFLKFLKFKFIRLSTKLGFSIPLNVFGKGLSIAHRGTIVVSCESKIGDYCRIHEGVTIGVSGDAYWGEQKGLAPIIGNNVFLGSGCKIIGPVTISDGVAIGANAVVLKSIEEQYSSWAGVPAKLITKKGSKQYIKRV